ncbi:hypothetical protein KY285_036326 [Solanum tuberosum]|nr:hypothetical protein KY285_036326 [Solanum tuberosum]
MTDYNQRIQRSKVVGACSPLSDKMVLISAEEFAKFSQYQKILKESTSVDSFVESNKTCLITSSNKWVIDLGGTNHMTDVKLASKKFQKILRPGRLRGSDNVVEIYRRCYEKQPLVIQGARAGNDTIAAGVLVDILDIQDLFP